MKPLALLQEGFAVFGVHSLQQEFHGLQALRPFRWNAEQGAKPSIEEGGAFGVVHLVEPETGEVGSGLQTSPVGAKRLVRRASAR